jgi:hypothetical protein
LPKKAFSSWLQLEHMKGRQSRALVGANIDEHDKNTSGDDNDGQFNIQKRMHVNL